MKISASLMPACSRISALAPLPMNAHDVEAVLGSGEVFRVAVDQGDFVPFQREALAEKIADLAGADDQDAHGIPVAVRG